MHEEVSSLFDLRLVNQGPSKMVDGIAETANLVDVRVGLGVTVWHYANLYDCTLEDDVMIGAFCEIQGATVRRGSRVQSHSFVCEGVIIGEDVFVGHHSVFINDNSPRTSTSKDRSWTLEPITVEDGASIGSNATIIGGVTIGAGAMIGAGSVVTKDVPPGETWAGNPAAPTQGSTAWRRAVRRTRSFLRK